MLEFKRISLRDFSCFKEATLEYGSSNITLVQGANWDSGAANSNMSGKTTLITEALLWVLFGIGTKEKGPDGSRLPGVRVEDIIRSGASSCRVVLDFEKEGKPYRVVRTRTRSGGATLELFNGKTLIKEPSIAATQTVLLQLLGGLSYETFTQTVLFGQGSKRFTLAKDSERKAILEELLGLEFYSRVREDVSVSRREASRALSDAEAGLDVLIARKRSIEEQIDSVHEDLEGLSNSKRREKEEFEDSVKKYEDEKRDWERVIRSHAKSVTETKAKLLELEESLNFLPTPKQLEEASALSSELTQSFADENSQIRILDERLRQFKNLEGVCPTCEQGIPKSHIETVVSALISSEEEHKQKREKIGEARRALDPVLASGKEASSLRMEIALAQQDLERSKESEKRAERSLAKLVRPVFKSSYAGMESRLRIRLKDLSKKLQGVDGEMESLEDSLRILNQRSEDLDFWWEGFGPSGIKALLFDNILYPLNEIANCYVGQLTDGEVEITLDTEALEGRDRFDVRISSSGGEGYHICSGGLRRRVDFCIALALQTLQAHRGARCNLYLCDEPFESVDDAGVEGVVQLLREFSLENNLSVYVITHLSGLQDFFDAVITVEKKGGISRVKG